MKTFRINHSGQTLIKNVCKTLKRSITCINRCERSCFNRYRL